MLADPLIYFEAEDESHQHTRSNQLCRMQSQRQLRVGLAMGRGVTMRTSGVGSLTGSGEGEGDEEGVGDREGEGLRRVR